jgi:peptidoglycan/xylan/chitin deacetylase (PgdA/CDA1 family)
VSLTLVVRTPAGYEAERRYVADLVLSEWLGFDVELSTSPGSTVSIALQGDPGSRILTLPDVLFGIEPDAWLTERAMPARPLARVTPAGAPPGALPVVFGVPLEGGAAWQETPGGLTLSIDVFGSAFYLLTGFEEVAQPVRDVHGRFPAQAALSVLEGFVERPIVDEYVALLWAAMQRLWPAIDRRPTTYRLRPTHDVDRPWASWGLSAKALARSVGGDLVRRHDPILAARRIRSRIGDRSDGATLDPYATYDWIMDVSEEHGLRSTFYFMAGNEPGEPDFRYRLRDAPFAPILRRIHDRGHEIGLHGSYGSHRSAARLRLELAGLKRACEAAGFEQRSWGVRQHYLRFENPTTWRAQEAAGLTHDSTIGYAERVGFRSGTCRQYPVFDLRERRVLALRERPLVAMDGTLLEYMGLGLGEAGDRLRAVAGACRGAGGDAVILYHTDTLAREAMREHYRRAIADLAPTAPGPSMSVAR